VKVIQLLPIRLLKMKKEKRMQHNTTSAQSRRTITTLDVLKSDRIEPQGDNKTISNSQR
jgi:hypothetical protein